MANLLTLLFSRPLKARLPLFDRDLIYGKGIHRAFLWSFRGSGNSASMPLDGTKVTPPRNGRAGEREPTPAVRTRGSRVETAVAMTVCRVNIK